MEVTDELKHEHRDIERVIDVIETMSERLARGDSSMVGLLHKASSFIKGFAEGCHHVKEEEVLFPALESHGVSKESGPIGAMLYEHASGRKYIAEIEQALSQYEAGDKEAANAVVNSVKGYTSLLRAHIQKEDMVLFPMAEKVFSEFEKHKLHEQMEEVEQRLEGKTHHEYLRDIEDMERAVA
ncbi:MAG: hemerythrin domain-containing protein [Firmicutes bacterium]|nr:hemerythrin domain-containing protein [Bacillota bacterium]